jgi:hypothetical protein
MSDVAEDKGVERNRTHLVTEGMTANSNGFDPSRDGLGDLGEDNGLTEDCAAEDVADLIWA